MNETDAKEKIHAAITNSEYLWRTLRGIAADTRLPEETILQVINTADGFFLEAERLNERGQKLYTTREKYLANTPWRNRLRDLILNKVGA